MLMGTQALRQGVFQPEEISMNNHGPPAAATGEAHYNYHFGGGITSAIALGTGT